MIFEDIENEVKEREQFVFSQNERIKAMIEVLNELIEYRSVLERADQMIHGQTAQNLRRSIGSIQQITEPLDQEYKVFTGNNTNKSVDSEELKEDGHKSQQLNASIRLDSSFREVSIKYVAGTISKEDMLRFKRMLFRVTRGKLLSHFDDITTPLKQFQGQNLQKVVYILIFQEGEHFKERVLRICDSFQSKRFSLPGGGHGDQNQFQRKMKKIDKKIQETQQMIKITKKQMHSYLQDVNSEESVAFSTNEVYRQFIMKEKMIYRVMNQLKKEGNLYYGFFWSNNPKHELIKKFEGVHRGNMDIQDHNVQIEEILYTKIRPPTHIPTNEFTRPFQMIVDTYGIPTYKEINPAVFATVTFPFLFGVMFADIGHGSVIFLVGLFLCFFESTLKYRMPSLKPLVQARYLMLLMGLFALYNGLIYNDMMAIPLQLFKSCYDPETGDKIQNDCMYPLGVDPIWYISQNELVFMNSLKMKISVILGVLQMSLGIVMKALNAIRSKNKLDFYHEFIPQILLLFALFGYMDCLIVIKWTTDYSGKEHEAPSIISTMISLVLDFGSIKGQPFIGSVAINKGISNFILIIVLICVPWMLFAKPLILRKDHDNQVKYQGSAPSEEIELQDLQGERNQRKNFNIFVEEEAKEGDERTIGGMKGSPNGSEFDLMIGHNKTNEETVLELLGQSKHETHSFTDIFIHQMIETIEFVLGTISNTASYLRLWALSLAHSQLASVFFEQTIMVALKQGSAIGLILGYPCWASATLGVLLVMDVMECFLHTLRLHWVEFQNKFYKGQGYKFIPFSFFDIFDEHNQ